MSGTCTISFTEVACDFKCFILGSEASCMLKEHVCFCCSVFVSVEVLPCALSEQNFKMFETCQSKHSLSAFLA